MRLSEAYGAGKFGLSFELFPPKTPAGEEEMFRHLEQLLAFRPSYITCTYGAGGSTRDKTLDIVCQVRQRFALPVASHLTCVGASVDQLRSYLNDARVRGVDYIVALRGDPPQGQASFQPTAGGLQFASDLTALIKREFPTLGIAVAGYPETHQEAASPEADLDNLRRKVDAGGEIVITQLFYCNDDFFSFRDRCRRAGIHVPIVPGILPVTNLAQIQRITAMCGAKLPLALVKPLTRHADDVEGQFRVGVEFATRQVQELVDSQVPGLHFYVLNKSPATCAVLGAVRLPATRGAST